MTTLDPTRHSASRITIGAVESLLRSRRGLLILATALLGLGAFFSWPSLVAVGIAPLVVAAIPCVAMCTLGLCMGKMASGRDAATTPNDADAAPLRLSMPPEALTPAPTADDVSARSPATGRSCCH